ncbi:unnamed protein product [Effrenium voratum]|nr:unnamed protein product [Effrenium voratum]
MRDGQGWYGFCSVCKRPVDVKIAEPQLMHTGGDVPAVARGRCAFLVCLWGSSKDYVLGALVLGFAIKRTRTRHSLVCLHTSDVPLAHINLLRLFWDCRLVDHVQVSAASRLSTDDKVEESRFSNVFTKLRALEQTDFEKVLVMDIDLLVVSNIDDLFELPAPAAMKRGMNRGRWPYKHGDDLDGGTFFSGREPGQLHSWGQGTGINAGVMLLAPSAPDFAQMQEELLEPYHPAHARGNGPEQDYLSRFYADRPWRHISVENNFQVHHMYNALHPLLDDAERLVVSRSFESIRVIHYSGDAGVKPWTRCLQKTHGWPSRDQDEQYMEDFLNDYHSYLLWVKKERERWTRMERHMFEESSLKGFSLGEDGTIYHEDENGKVPKETSPEAITAALDATRYFLKSWFDMLEAANAALQRDLVADLSSGWLIRLALMPSLHRDKTSPVSAGPEACRAACCDDQDCEVWQFNAFYACYRGKSDICMRTADTFAADSVGERLRGAKAGPQSGLVWAGRRQAYAELMDVDTSGPRSQTLQGLDGGVYHLWRHGARLEVDVSCWSHNRHPEWCCEWNGPPLRTCWGQAAALAAHCCKEGMSEDKLMLYNVFARSTSHLTAAELNYFDKLFPDAAVDEAAFNSSRLRWRLGRHPPGSVCASGLGDGSKATVDGSSVLWPLALLLGAFAEVTGTFVNIGAGTCLPPDPLFQLLASPEGHGFLGLAVEADSTRLARCAEEMARTYATVVPVHLSLDPTTAASQLYPFVAPMFPEASRPWPLDFLVVDIDGCDCLVAEELMQLVRPKVLQLEIAFHFPPPFRFSLHWDAVRSPTWNAEYDIDTLNPVSGCSLSYALSKFKPFGYHLLRLTSADAVFVHESVANAVERGLQLKLPQDEFLCYRSSTLWMQMPSDYVREWFFASHPALVYSRIWANISALSREIGREDAPFTLDF